MYKITLRNFLTQSDTLVYNTNIIKFIKEVQFDTNGIYRYELTKIYLYLN